MSGDLTGLCLYMILRDLVVTWIENHRIRKLTLIKEDIGKILGKLPRTTKIPLHGNGMAAISKISREIQTKSFAKFYKTLIVLKSYLFKRNICDKCQKDLSEIEYRSGNANFGSKDPFKDLKII